MGISFNEYSLSFTVFPTPNYSLITPPKFSFTISPLGSTKENDLIYGVSPVIIRLPNFFYQFPLSQWSWETKHVTL